MKSFIKKVAYFFSQKNTNLASARLDKFLFELKPNRLLFYLYFVYFQALISIFFLVHIFKFILNIEYRHKSISPSDLTLNVESKKILKLINDSHKKLFPITHKPLHINNLLKIVNLDNLAKWKKLLSNYDVIIGYSTDGIFPLIANTPYIAFEHGTIRDLPYQDNINGALCAVTYAKANHVFVTNFDCKESAEFLAPNKYSLINHPFDENHSDRIMDADGLRNKLLRELESDFLFFFPTRHDWVEGTGYADKANNTFLNAFGSLRKLGYRVGMVCCAWGQNVDSSKKLLSDLNVEKYVRWGEPMAIMAFERTALACDCVVDQFKLGSFGGILFKAMATGSPVMTYLNEEMLNEQFREMPPVLNCRNEKDIIEMARSIYEKPEAKEVLRQKSREWINRHHSKQETINKQLAQFEIMLQHKLTRNVNDAQRPNI